MTQLVRGFAYDGFGNVASVSEYSVAAGPTAARTTTFDFHGIDPQFPETVTVEGVNLTTILEFDPLLGVRTSVTGPDGLETSFEYDDFGRLTREVRPAGDTDFSYHVCASNGCFAPNAAFYVRADDSTGATSFGFFDAFERPVGRDAPLAGGRRSREQTVYLPSGRVDQRSLPYVAGESVHFVTIGYDAIGRVVSEEDESGGSTTYDYLGLALEVTDGNQHTTRYEHNALSQIERVVDAMAGETAYTYHPFGELHTVTDDDLNETEILYDARGFKTDMYDPDMGHWQYDHNAYGELVEQIDAKNQIVTLAYDPAGRLEERVEDEGTTTFTFYPDTAAAGHAGRLQQVSSPGGLSETYEYHATHGAVTEIFREIGAADYYLNFAHDTHGRVTQITYPENVDSQRLAVEYLFDGWGALSQVRNATTTSLVYYTQNEQDGSGAVRRATLGNGVVEQYDYEATTGRLASIKAGPSGSAALQNLEFEWDLAGNLEQREVRNSSGTLVDTDVFGYDALDRLATVTRDSTQILSVTYDALGNIDTKTGVGTYAYGGSRPHAVTAIGSLTFGYDANGNMTDRDTTEIDWTSYNLPSRIERASGEYSEFLYGADRSRYQQIEGVGALQSMRHYASPGLFEVLTWNGGASRVDYHYIHANGRAVAQFTTSNVEADALTYLHRDHQGSVVLTTDTTGGELDRFEYDAFGVRTTTVGSDERMHRGYTGHEELAALDLVHMNGRVQDPLLGRFLSPDPFVQAPYHSQSLNRYSYVWNNPLSLVDPSGFEGDCPKGVTCTKIPPPGTPGPGECERMNIQCGDDPGWFCVYFGCWVDVVPVEDTGGFFFATDIDGNEIGSSWIWSDTGESRTPGEIVVDYLETTVQNMADGMEYTLYLNQLAAEGDDEALHELVQRGVPFGPGGITKVVGARQLATRAAAGVTTRVAGQGFSSFGAFKRAAGPAGSGQAWHHIVEQTPANIAKFGPQAVHNTANIVKLPHGAGSVHAQVSGLYSSIRPDITGSTSLRVREWLSTQSFEAQHSFGQRAIQNISSGVW